jgi:hypothetical protein
VRYPILLLLTAALALATAALVARTSARLEPAPAAMLGGRQG